MTNHVRIVLADDHAVVRAGIANALSRLSNIKIVGEANDGYSLLSVLSETLPDLLVTDVTMPNFEPIETTREIRVCYPEMKILVVSAYDDDMYVQGLLSAGVNGYQLKDQPLSDLRLAVQRVLAGETWVCGPLVRKLVHAHDTAPPPAALPLTTRQQDMLLLLSEGLDNHAMARRTGLSVKTIENHLTRLYRQINVQSRLEAANYSVHHPEMLAGARLLPHQAASGESAGPARPVILIIDDNTGYRTQLRRMVSKNCPQAVVYEASNIALALRAVEEFQPQLVLVDVVLGDENGIDCVQRIRELAPQGRAVLISAYPDREFRRAGRNAGAVAFLDKKDLDNAALREVLADLID
ncbi:MAG: response regulator [Chloroflexota bacterium]|nr:response regulator [Chloroflexota bacterium]